MSSRGYPTTARVFLYEAGVPPTSFKSPVQVVDHWFTNPRTTRAHPQNYVSAFSFIHHAAASSPPGCIIVHHEIELHAKCPSSVTTIIPLRGRVPMLHHNHHDDDRALDALLGTTEEGGASAVRGWCQLGIDVVYLPSISHRYTPRIPPTARRQHSGHRQAVDTSTMATNTTLRDSHSLERELTLVRLSLSSLIICAHSLRAVLVTGSSRPWLASSCFACTCWINSLLAFSTSCSTTPTGCPHTPALR